MLITRTVNENIESKAIDFDTGILILGKSRNFIKSELGKILNVFTNKIICAEEVSTESVFGLKNLLIIFPDDTQRKNALIASVMASANGTNVYIFAVKPFFAAKNFARGVIITREELLITAVTAAAENFARGHEMNLDGESFYVGFASSDPLETVCGLAAELPDGMKNAAVFVSHPAGFDFSPFKNLLGQTFFGYHSFYSLIFGNEDTELFRADAFIKQR
ncbi:MAG: hypothetical protein LBM87_07080 [Ruminococcus sp.]|nr:hypothetical protein [Ruminococcus sp.]